MPNPPVESREFGGGVVSEYTWRGLTMQLPRRLKSVKPLGPYEINVGALSKHHVGLVVAVARKQNTLTGRLTGVPVQSRGNTSLLVVHLGDFCTALHPSDAVMVIPNEYRARIFVEKREAAS